MNHENYTENFGSRSVAVKNKLIVDQNMCLHLCETLADKQELVGFKSLCSIARNINAHSFMVYM